MGLKNTVTYNDIINKIGCEKVFKHYFGDFNLSDAYRSVLRDDNKKSTGFFVTKEGTLLYHDFRTGEKLNCVNFVRKLLSLQYKKNFTFSDALIHISNTFSIEGTGEDVRAPILKPKEKSIFKVYTRPFTPQDLKWWMKYGITQEELIRYNIFSVAKFEAGKGTFITKKNELRFAYLFKDGDEGYFKIYTPLDIERKWYFNGKQHLVYGLEYIDFVTQPSTKKDKLIITKSVKDYIVLRKFFTDVIAMQNEGSGAITEELILELKKRYKHIIIFFDMDRAGIKAANFFKKKYNFIPFFIGDRKKTIWQNLKLIKKISTKDPSDFVYSYGLESLKKYLEKYKIL